MVWGVLVWFGVFWSDSMAPLTRCGSIELPKSTEIPKSTEYQKAQNYRKALICKYTGLVVILSSNL